MSRLEAGNIQPKLDWCDVNELIYAVLNRLKENLEGRRVNVVIDEPMPLCRLDEGLMEQVLYNLIINAHLYTPAESVIDIHGTFNNQGLVLVVQDNGNGLDPAEIELVFDKFYRSKNTLINGTGLGLSIVKGFTEVHKGKVVVGNIPGGGARFTITIPAETNYINKLKNE
jgi:two-component system sensor histidine kinase KdpD